jgi:hypothetical protein
MRVIYLKVLLVLNLFVGTAMADAELRFVDPNDEQSFVLAKSDMVRVEKAGSKKMFMLFDVKQDLLTVVNIDNKTFQRIDQARIDQAAEKIATAKAKLRENFANLSPEQQKQIQPMIERMAVAEAREQRIEKGDKDKVAGVDCVSYQVFENDKPSQRLCVADAKALNVSQQDYEAISAMLVMLADLSNKMGGGMMETAISPEDTGGIPVRTVDGDNKATRLIRVETDTLSAAWFQVPDDYRETAGQ